MSTPSSTSRPKIRVRIERSAQCEQALLRPHVSRIELGIAHRTLQHRCRGAAGVERLVRQGLPCRTNRGAADQAFLDFDLGHEQFEREPRLLRDLWPDTVARQEDDDFAATRRQALPPRASAVAARAGVA